AGPRVRTCGTPQASRRIVTSARATVAASRSRIAARMAVASTARRGACKAPRSGVWETRAWEGGAGMRVATYCIALLGLLVFGLGLGVSMLRGSTQTTFGYTPDPTDRLYKMVRAHGNAAEYAPMMAVRIFFPRPPHPPA